MYHQHPNVHWFERHKTLPQPSGKPVSLHVPFWAFMVGVLCVAPTIGVFWALALALTFAVGIGMVERHGNTT